MPDPADKLILYPAFAMFALVAGVLAYMGRLRFGAVSRGEMDPRFYKTYEGGEEPERMRVVTRHFINLFEVPVLFYVVVIMTYVTHLTNTWMIACAWAYVAARYLHSYVHLTSNDVLTRFRVYIASGAILLVMWASLFARLMVSG